MVWALRHMKACDSLSTRTITRRHMFTQFLEMFESLSTSSRTEG
jgi:hypothetical protein